MNKNIVKKLIAIVIQLTMISSMVIPSGASSEISVYLNDDKIDFDVAPAIINGRTMVPMRAIFESLGAVVTWDSASQTATGKRGDTIINISINSTTLFKNGVPTILDSAPTIIDSRTLVPVRAIAESFDCAVDWIAESRTVKISTDIPIGKTKLSATEISEKVSPSVFYIEVFDDSDQLLGSGSGFFISSDGVAVTNYHVIQDSACARITTINGSIYDVTSVIAYDVSLDIAVIRVSKTSTSGKKVSGFPKASMGDSDSIKAGQTIYALGSPVGLQNTISNGIISNVKQIVGNETFIQITAPISHGSSGGALVNEYGEVLGITSAGITDAENIGFAIPINIINQFDLTQVGEPYYGVAQTSQAPSIEFYPGTSIPTLTSVLDLPLIKIDEDDGKYSSVLYSYECYEPIQIAYYMALLEEYSFTLYEEDHDANTLRYRYLSPDDKLVSIVLPSEWPQVWIICSL